MSRAWRCRTCGNTNPDDVTVDFMPAFAGDQPSPSDVCPECDEHYARTHAARRVRGVRR